MGLDVDTLELGPGTVQLAGFSSMSGRAGAIEAQGSGGLSFGGDVSLKTAQVRAGSGVSYAIDVGGTLELLSGTGVALDPAKIGLGGTLAITAGSGVTLDTGVVVPAGTFEVTAASGAVSLGKNASVDVSGRAVDFSSDPQEPVRQFAPGGLIRLVASEGDVDVDSQASLNVSSGSTLGGDAGSIELVAGPNATASVHGTLKGAAGSSAYAGGSFSLDAGTAADQSSLVSGLGTGGFDESVSVRLRGSQGITIAAGQTLTAHEVVLISDGGQVSVAGTIDASGTTGHPNGGKVELSGYDATQGVDAVTVSGTLDAHAGAAAANGYNPSSPEVLIVANGAGAITLAGASVVDVSGGRSATGSGLTGGLVVLRAPRAGSDVAIAPIAGTVRGAMAVVVQGVDEEAASGSVSLTPYLASATSWLGNQSTILARVGGTNSDLKGLLTLGAGIALEDAAGDLSITNNIDLHGQLGAGYLGLLASGNIAITGAVVSDGFSGTGPGATLLGTNSVS